MPDFRDVDPRELRVSTSRRHEVERFKVLVAELMLDTRMLQDVAKKKVVTATQQRAAANYLREKFAVSERRVSQVLGRARSQACSAAMERLGSTATGAAKKPKKLGSKPGLSANSCVNQPARFKNDVST